MKCNLKKNKDVLKRIFLFPISSVIYVYWNSAILVFTITLSSCVFLSNGTVVTSWIITLGKEHVYHS